MAVIKAVSSKAGIGQALDYVTKEEKTEDKLVSGLHCEPDTVKDEMQATKELWGKTGGRTYKHFVQEATMRTASDQSKPIKMRWSLPRVQKHGKGMRYSLPRI